jgi:hypothetical protein
MMREILPIAIASANGFAPHPGAAIHSANFSTAALISAKRESERLRAQATAARYAQEIAWRSGKDSRYGGAIDLPLFADV